MSHKTDAEGWLSIVGPARGRRRAGMVFGAAPVVVSLAELSQDVIDALKGDPDLAVQEIDAADAAKLKEAEAAMPSSATAAPTAEDLDTLTAERARIMADTLIADAVARAVADLTDQLREAIDRATAAEEALTAAEGTVAALAISRDEEVARADAAEKALEAARQSGSDGKETTSKRSKG